jgi:SAM-dependent methyltransferase
MKTRRELTPASRWDAGLYDGSHSFVWKYGEELLELLAPRGGERVLDVGCGTGHLTAQIAERGAQALGIDNSPTMIEHARGRYPAIRFRLADIRTFRSRARFDAVFSNATLHWVRPPEQAIRNIHDALRQGGRFVAEFGGKGNVHAFVGAICEALRAAGHPDPESLNPWYYPSLGEYAGLLEQHGFRVACGAHFDRLTPLEDGEEGIRNWLRMFAHSFLNAMPPERRCALVEDIERRLRPKLYRRHTWHADYRRLRIVALRED